ncbi:MAG: LuxR C-terminal-related transcriptional regulator, partial [Leucobacter sp.]
PADDTDLMGVPELYAAALERLTDADTLTRTRTRIADHLLAQEAIGIPLAGRESIFCARALGRNGKRSKGQDLDDHQAEFLLRIIDDLTSFGEGHQARDLLLRLGTRGHDIDDLTRARLTALLSDAHSGLQLLVSSHQVSSASSFKDLEAQEQFAHLLLRGHLSAEAGLPPDFAADFAADDPALADALLVAQRWNDTAPLGKDRSDLLRIARTHEQPEVALLAEQLLALDAALIGCSYPSFSELPVEQRISRLAIGAVASRRDALVCASVTQAVIRFFTSGGERADRPLISLPDRLPGATRHRVWATHIHTARIAMLVGDLERAHAEWAEFVRRTPRFIPRRLSAIIERMGATRTAETGQGNEAHSLIGNTQQVLGYFAGTLDHVNGAAFAPLRERPGPFIGNLSKEDRAGIAELSEIAPIRAHLDAHRTQNPLALMRAADGLMEFGFCAPASYALQEARRIFLKRRASGSVGTADARLAEVRARAARYAPWLETEELPKPTRERLTPRETTAATLAASGLTNRSIAEEMGCSVRTVESHISQARAKLGASSRDELAEQLRALGVLAGRSVSLAPKREAALDSR